MSVISYSLTSIIGFVVTLAAATAVIEFYLWTHFHYYDRKWFVPISVAAVPLCYIACAAVPAFSVLPQTAAAISSVLLTELISAVCFRYFVRGKFALSYMLIAPAFIGLGFLIIYPLVFEVYLAFHDLKLTTIMSWSQTGQLPFVGFKNFVRVFTTSPLSRISFWELLMRTLGWTFINVFFHVCGGFALALLLNRKMKFKGIYRTLLIIPWAMPQVVAVLAMRGEFHSQYGFINIMIIRLTEMMPFLSHLGIGPVQWLGNHAFLTCTIINIWLGIPFMMVVILGGLQSISQHYYDAAEIDGASAFQQFRMITLPLIKPVLAPAVTLGTVWTFNNINVIYLVTGQAGGIEDADILVSALYKSAFTFFRYSYSAAFAIVIFALLFGVSMLWLKLTKGTDSVYE